MNVINRILMAGVVYAVLSIAAQPGRAQTSSTPNLAGNWQGVLSAGQQKLRIEIKMTEPSAGHFARTSSQISLS